MSDPNRVRDIFILLIRNVGMTVVLKSLISANQCFQSAYQEHYLKKLEFDLQTALNNYEHRYDLSPPR